MASIKIHAAKGRAPQPGNPHATAWRAVVTDERGTTREFDSVRIHGPATVVSLPYDGPGHPAVFVQPDHGVICIGFREGSEPESMVQVTG